VVAVSFRQVSNRARPFNKGVEQQQAIWIR
jgi:hypothetical protein